MVFFNAIFRLGDFFVWPFGLLFLETGWNFWLTRLYAIHISTSWEINSWCDSRFSEFDPPSPCVNIPTLTPSPPPAHGRTRLKNSVIHQSSFGYRNLWCGGRFLEIDHPLPTSTPLPLHPQVPTHVQRCTRNPACSSFVWEQFARL